MDDRDWQARDWASRGWVDYPSKNPELPTQGTLGQPPSTVGGDVVDQTRIDREVLGLRKRETGETSLIGQEENSRWLEQTS